MSMRDVVEVNWTRPTDVYPGEKITMTNGPIPGIDTFDKQEISIEFGARIPGGMSMWITIKEFGKRKSTRAGMVRMDGKQLAELKAIIDHFSTGEELK